VVSLVRNNIYIIFALFFLISIAPFFGKLYQKHNAKVAKSELYNSELHYVNSIDKALKYTDSIYLKNNFQSFDTSQYVQIVSRFTKERFYHGLSHYSISDNWIAFLSGKLVWSHLSAIVDPDDILAHPDGLCSQQTIIFMEMLKRKKINVRSVGLGFKEGPGHFLSEAHYNGVWHLHDVTMEPVWEKVVNHHKSMDYYLKNKDSLYLAYESRYDKQLFNKLLERITYGKVNEFPAKIMLLFHQITLLFTYLLPLFFLFMFIRSFDKINSDKKQAINSSKQTEVLYSHSQR
jgi:hypothetical protein